MKYIFILLLIFPKFTFAQNEKDYSIVVNDYFNMCYKDPKLKEDGNYLIVPGYESKVPKNYILYINYLKKRDDNRSQSIKRYFKNKINDVDWNPTNVFNKLVNSGKFDTSYTAIKNINCIGGLLLHAMYFIKSKNTSHIYLNITKFNSKHPSTQADFIVEYIYIKGRWKYISEKMLSIT